LPLLKNNKANFSDCHPEHSRWTNDATDATNSTTLIRDSIARASTATPWNSTCLLKSMAARWMLKQRRVPSCMSIGMGKDERGQRVMHAEISVGEIQIVSKINEFKELYLFE